VIKPATSNKKGNADASAENKDDKPNSLPKTNTQYRARLVKYKAEIYKDPPVLPPVTMSIEPQKVALPKRNAKTGELTFPPGNNTDTNKLLKDFHPNRTPQEVLEAGSFGGTYFRPIGSSVTNVYYKSYEVIQDTLSPEWIQNLDVNRMLTSTTYRNAVNKYGVKCGGSLGMWESSGWIADCDPYGWFQWYCRFYQGRRSSDDQRQISRWNKSAGVKGRFRSQLCNKILAAQTTAEDRKISPVIRQTLLHWGLEITPMILEAHKKRTGK